MALDSCWKVAVLGVGPAGEAIVNTFYFAYDNPDSSIDPNTVAGDFDAALPNTIATLVTGDWTYIKTTVHCLTGTNANKSGESNASAPITGGLGGPACPINVCCIAKKLTAGVGKHGRGRCFFSPINATMVDTDGRVTLPVGYAANLTALMNTVTSVGHVFKMVVCRKSGLFPNAVTQINAAALCGVQRRRRLRQPN